MQGKPCRPLRNLTWFNGQVMDPRMTLGNPRIALKITTGYKCMYTTVTTDTFVDWRIRTVSNLNQGRILSLQKKTKTLNLQKKTKRQH